jgi:hypothetical protein
MKFIHFSTRQIEKQFPLDRKYMQREIIKIQETQTLQLIAMILCNKNFFILIQREK